MTKVGPREQSARQTILPIRSRMAISVLWGLVASSAIEAQAPLADVPFVLHQNAIIMTMVANDRDTVALLLDTGWGPVALTDSAVARLNHSGAGLPQVGGVVTLASLSVQGLRKKRVLAEVFRAGDLTPLIGPYDGVLGTEFFKDLVLQVDYPRSRVRFFSRMPVTQLQQAAGSKSVLPMTFARGAGALPFTDSLFVNGRQSRGLFDTGGAGAFLAMQRLITSQRLDARLDSTRAQMGFFDGSLKRANVRFGRLAEVRLGRIVVDTPRVLLAPPGLTGASWGHDLVIGYGFMRQYVVTFDYPGRSITLQRVHASSSFGAGDLPGTSISSSTNQHGSADNADPVWSSKKDFISGIGARPLIRVLIGRGHRYPRVADVAQPVAYATCEAAMRSTRRSGSGSPSTNGARIMSP